MMSSKPSASRKTTKVGLVTSSAADKSVVVKVENMVMHPLYSKFVRTSFEVHGARRGKHLQRGRPGTDRRVPAAFQTQTVARSQGHRAGAVVGGTP